MNHTTAPSSAKPESLHAKGPSPFKSAPLKVNARATLHKVGVQENGTYFVWRHRGKAYERRFEGLPLLVLQLVGRQCNVQDILSQTAQLDISPERTEQTIVDLCQLGILAMETMSEHDEGRSWFA